MLPAVQNPGGYLLVDPGRRGGQPLAGLYGVTHVGQEVVILFEDGDPDHPIVVGNPITPGVPILAYPGLGTSSNLDSVVCIQIGGVWQRSTGTCEVSGGASAPNGLSIPAATTLLVDTTGSLNVNGGVLTLNGNAANPGALTISGGGVLTLGPTGSVNVNGGVLTLNGNPANPPSSEVDQRSGHRRRSLGYPSRSRSSLSSCSDQPCSAPAIASAGGSGSK